MALRQHSWVNKISPDMGTCGSLIKVEPIYPHSTVSRRKIVTNKHCLSIRLHAYYLSPSQVVVNVYVNVKDLDHVVEKMHVLSSKGINVHGTLDVVESSTNKTTRSWDLNVNVESGPAHINNNLKVQITRITPGEKNLKVFDFSITFILK